MNCILTERFIRRQDPQNYEPYVDGKLLFARINFAFYFHKIKDFL